MALNLTPKKALIFRITHVRNLPWILKNGLHCRTSSVHDPEFVPIGNAELIEKRHYKRIECEPGGTLSDYVPFYFTPASPMMYNIATGWGGITKRSNSEIVVLVTSLRKLQEQNVPFLFSDRHAYLAAARFYHDLTSLSEIPWDDLNQRNFRKDPENPEKVERYQAEALVHRHLPVCAVLGIGCHAGGAESQIKGLVAERGLGVQVVVRRDWFF